VATNAPGAEVFIDDVSRGATDSAGNLRLESVKPDSRILKIVKPGFQERLEMLNLKPGEPSRIQMNLAPMAASPAVLSVSSVPPEAEVYIDDQFKGSTPLNGIKVDPGAHRLRLKKDGYRDIEKPVEFRAGEARAEPFSLERAQGTVQFSIQPEGATAKIGARTFDTGRQKQLELEAGIHTVELSLAGYKPLQKTVMVQDRQTTVLQAVLEPVVSAPVVAGYADAFLNLDNWEHPAGWLADRLMHASGAGFGILKDRVYQDIRQNFQLRLTRGDLISWLVRWQDARNYCLIQLISEKHPDKARRNTICFSVVKDGQPSALQQVPLPFPFGRNRGESVDVLMELSGNQMIAKGGITSGTTTTGIREWGRYSIPANIPARGRIGFAVFGDEEFDISGFVVDPIIR